MTTIDWTIVVLLNGLCIGYGLYLSRGTQTATDWFLAGRTLPFWIVGLSLYATAIDSSDLVADAGGTYQLGMSYFVTNWIGVVAGWVIAANWVVLPMFRRGMFTNAEYLEARFGPSARITSALVQVQYRTMVLGIIANTIYLTLAIVCGWGPGTWWAVLFIAALAAVYTTWGGLKSVAVTDAMQSVVMIVAAFALFCMVWQKVGGFEGARQKLDAHQTGLADQLLHVGADRTEIVETETGAIERRTPGWVVCVAFIIAGLAYSLVNHTQSMRLFGAKSEWDLKMAAVVAGAVLLVATFFNLSMGVFGRALFPDPSLMALGQEALQKPDAIYPLLIREYLPVGLTGLVVAGVLAASFSTFDSIGSTLAALITRDIYARLMVKNGEDRHYLKVGRCLTPVVIFGSFAYVPFLQERGMLLYYLDLVAVFVVPLLGLYLMGIFSPVHRQSGMIGLLAGVVYGLCRLLRPDWLPGWLADGFAAYPVSLFMTAGVMVLASCYLGWQRPGDLQSESAGGWLATSQHQVASIDQAHAQESDSSLPMIAGLILIGIGALLSFVVFW